MFRKQVVLLFSVTTLLFACQVELSQQITPVTVEHTSQPTLSMKLEWSTRLPMGWRAEQGVIIQDVVCFSNFGLTPGGLPTVPILAAFNLNTKELSWHIEQKPLIPVVSDGDRLLTLTDKGIEAISVANGSTLWQTAIVPKDNYYDSDELLAQDGWIFYGDNASHASNLYGLDAQTGAIVWTTSLSTPMDWFKPSGASRALWAEYRALVYDHGRLYVRVVTDISEEDHLQFALIVLDAKNGHRLWEFPFEIPATKGDSPPGAASRLAFGEQTIYFGIYGDTSYALQSETGKVLWQRKGHLERPVYINNQIVAISGYQAVAGLDALTGDLNWTLPFMNDGIGELSPFDFYDNYLVFYSGGNLEDQLSVVDIKSGERVFGLQSILPSDCIKSPIAFALRGEHLYLVTPDCANILSVQSSSNHHILDSDSL